jgi:hypothetical protein
MTEKDKKEIYESLSNANIVFTKEECELLIEMIETADEIRKSGIDEREKLGVLARVVANLVLQKAGVFRRDNISFYGDFL